MDPNSLPQWIVLIVLLIFSAVFSSAETALTSISEIRIRTLVDDGNKKAKIVLKLIENKDKMISAILIGNNAVNLSASALTTNLAIKNFDSTFIGIATGILTFIILVFGEITPKTIATKQSEKLSLFYGKFIYGFMVLMTPFIFVFNGCSKVLLKIFKVKVDDGPTLTEDDIQTVLDVSHEEGILEAEEHEMLTNIVTFGDTKVRDVMVPKVFVTFIKADSSYEELMTIFKDKKHTRYPVYRESTDDVVGIINMKDILLLDSLDGFSIEKILREPHFTYENKNTLELLAEMKKEAISASIVLDEYGVTAGYVTLEDLLEEIVGEIHDEYDEEEVEQIRQISAKTYIVEGSTPITECNEELKMDIESEDYDSIGGYMIENLGKMPEVGDVVITPKGDKITIKKLDNNRIAKVSIIMKKAINTGE